MTHGSLFSGIGGFDLAAEWCGWENVFHCEMGDFGQRVLKYYWPRAISYADIKKTDFTIHRGAIDVLSGGFPCQPYSQAGKRKGKEDDRHLWPEMLRAIREIQPVYVVGENVRGLTNWNGGVVFDEVQADLEAEGYEVLPFLLPACGVNAPHRRDRIWFIAHSNVAKQRNDGGADSRKTEEIWREKEGDVSGEFCSDGLTTNARKRGLQTNYTLRESERGVNTTWNDSKVIPTDTNSNQRREGRVHEAGPKEAKRHISTLDSWKDGGAWQDFPTQPPIRSRDDGVSTGLSGITVSKHRNESIRAYGNSIVPQVAYEIFKAINKYEEI